MASEDSNARPGQAASGRVDWPAVLAEHRRWLRTVVLARVGDAWAVDDVWQELATACVRNGDQLREPANPVLTTPNKITAADFEGWVQERGLYYANPWDPRYAAPLAANDPGEKPLAGGLLVAKDGQGTFVYTGLAFFRQLPAGVPGAWRLFANLVSGGK